MAKRTAPNPSSRLRLPVFGELMWDYLMIEAFCKGRSLAQEALSLLGAILYQRAAYREEMIAELARKRGISPDEMRDCILTGRAKMLTSAEYKELKQETEESASL